MKKVSLNLSAVMMAAMILASCTSGGTKDKESSNETTFSKEVTIGTQVWMTLNLDVNKFRNGEVILEAKTKGEWKAYSDAGEAAWCYYDNDRKNGEKYGKLYNWHAVNDPRGLAPKGWHVPTDEEWTILTDYLGGVEKAGAKMKSKNEWFYDGNGTNSSGFSGLPGGMRPTTGLFFHFGSFGRWWSSTEYNSNDAWRRSLFYEHGGVDKFYDDKGSGFSVRCIRD